MAEDRLTDAAPGASSTEDVKERVAKVGAQEDSGAGNKEADPATAENPPQDLREGDQKRS